jgi:hypothetical protein
MIDMRVSYPDVLNRNHNIWFEESKCRFHISMEALSTTQNQGNRHVGPPALNSLRDQGPLACWVVGVRRLVQLSPDPKFVEPWVARIRGQFSPVRPGCAVTSPKATRRFQEPVLACVIPRASATFLHQEDMTISVHFP